MGLIKKLVRDESAQGMAEYALLVGLIAVVLIVAVTSIGTKANTKMSDVASALS